MNRHLRRLFPMIMAITCAIPSVLAAERPVQPLPADLEAGYYGTAEDVLDKPVCPKGGARVTAKCRDSAHYVRTNESHHEVYRPYIENVGGGYVGIGSDQNFTFIAWAGSDFAWIMDYDPFVVAINQIHLLLIDASDNAEGFVAKWSRDQRASTVALIRQTFAARDDLDWLVQRFKNNQERLHGWFSRKYENKRGKLSHWLQSDEWYQRIRAMVKARRIRVMNGDLLKDVSLSGISEISRTSGPLVNVVYLSNAEEFWAYTPTFRDNFIKMPLGEHARILRTASTKKLGKRLGDRYVYFVQSGRDFKATLGDSSAASVKSYIGRVEKTGVEGVFTLGLSAP